MDWWMKCVSPVFLNGAESTAPTNESVCPCVPPIVQSWWSIAMVSLWWHHKINSTAHFTLGVIFLIFLIGYDCLLKVVFSTWPSLISRLGSLTGFRFCRIPKAIIRWSAESRIDRWLMVIKVNHWNVKKKKENNEIEVNYSLKRRKATVPTARLP